MLKRFYADRLRELHANYAGYLRSLKRDKMIIAIALGIVLVLLTGRPSKTTVFGKTCQFLFFRECANVDAGRLRNF